MELKIGEKVYTLKEIKYVDLLDWQNSGLNTAQVAKKLLQASAGLTEEEVNNLSFKEGIELQKAVNNINGFDFQ